jgi:mannose-6-phosphate isomerase-like protein (cupin superfamily)
MPGGTVGRVSAFPAFMRNAADAIASSHQSAGVEGYVFDGADGSQMAFWECREDGVSVEHTHDFDEYFVVLSGRYTLIIDDEKIPVLPGEEYHIPSGVPHAGEFVAGTRTIHAFGGMRATRRNQTGS